MVNLGKMVYFCKKHFMGNLHNCEIPENLAITDTWGIAISECFEDKDTFELWVGNGEYSNKVNFCPFCGYKSKAFNSTAPPDSNA
jgi:hypothetical protein